MKVFVDMAQAREDSGLWDSKALFLHRKPFAFWPLSARLSQPALPPIRMKIYQREVKE